MCSSLRSLRLQPVDERLPPLCRPAALPRWVLLLDLRTRTPTSQKHIIYMTLHVFTRGVSRSSSGQIHDSTVKTQ